MPSISGYFKESLCSAEEQMNLFPFEIMAYSGLCELRKVTTLCEVYNYMRY